MMAMRRRWVTAGVERAADVDREVAEGEEVVELEGVANEHGQDVAHGDAGGSQLPFAQLGQCHRAASQRNHRSLS